MGVARRPWSNPGETIRQHRPCASCTRNWAVPGLDRRTCSAPSTTIRRARATSLRPVVGVGWAVRSSSSPIPARVAAAYRIRCSELFRPDSPEIVAHPGIRPAPIIRLPLPVATVNAPTRRGPLPVQGSRPSPAATPASTTSSNPSFRLALTLAHTTLPRLRGEVPRRGGGGFMLGNTHK